MRVIAHRAVVSRDEPRQSNIQVSSKVDYVLKVLQCYMVCPFSWQSVDIVKCVVSGNFVHFLQVAEDKKSGNIIHRTGMKLLLFLTFCVKELVLYCTTLKMWWMVVRNVLVLRRTCNAKRSVNWTQPSVFVFLHGVPGRREVNDQSCTQKKKAYPPVQAVLYHSFVLLFGIQTPQKLLKGTTALVAESSFYGLMRSNFKHMS